MKKNNIIKLSIIFILLIALAAIILIVFLNKNTTFECYACEETYEAKPNKATISGETRELCDECYEAWKELMDEIDKEENNVTNSDEDKPNSEDSGDKTTENTTAQTVDIFSNIEIAYNGMSGEASAYIKTLATSDVLNSCEFEISPNYNLSSGDVITVTLTEHSVNVLLETYNIIAKETSRTYTVEGLSAYVTSAEQLPTETIKQLAATFLEEVSASLKDEYMFSYGKPKYDGTYFYTTKNNSWLAHENVLRIKVSYDLYAHGEYLRTDTRDLDFKDVVIDSDGNVSISYEDKTTLYIDQDYYDVVQVD